jgi:hypothetical protein
MRWFSHCNPAVYKYDTLDAALAQLHNELAYRAEGRTKTVCVILNSIGELVKREAWKAPVNEPEPIEPVE